MLLEIGGKCIVKCNFHIKHFDKIKCYAERPYLVFSELKPETYIYIYLALSISILLTYQDWSRTIHNTPICEPLAVLEDCAISHQSLELSFCLDHWWSYETAGNVYIWATTRENVSSGVSNQARHKRNWSAQPQKLARFLKFRLKNLEISYYLSSEQQRRWSDCADAQADLRLCC